MSKRLYPKIRYRAGDAIAVAPIRSSPGNRITALGQDLTAQLVQFLTEEASPQIQVYDRQFTAAKLNEYEFQWSQSSTQSEIVDFGHAIAAKILIVGQLDQAGMYYTTNLRAIDLRSGAVLAADQWQFMRTPYNDRRFAIVVGSSEDIAGQDQPPSGPPVFRHFAAKSRQLAKTLVECLRANDYRDLRIAVASIVDEQDYRTEYGRVLGRRIVDHLRIEGADLRLTLLQDYRNLQRMLRQQATEASPIFEQSTTSSIDQSLGAHALLGGTLNRVNNGISVNLWISDLESKQILCGSNIFIPYGKGQEELLRPMGDGN